MTHRREIAILPPHTRMTLPRTDAVNVESSTSFMSTLAGLASTVPGETAVRQRRKLWEFSSYLHCSIVGTCLSTTELRKMGFGRDTRNFRSQRRSSENLYLLG
jgi:hypothetical protein